MSSGPCCAFTYSDGTVCGGLKRNHPVGLLGENRHPFLPLTGKAIKEGCCANCGHTRKKHLTLRYHRLGWCHVLNCLCEEFRAVPAPRREVRR